jgi:hypothetical protein
VHLEPSTTAEDSLAIADLVWETDPAIRVSAHLVHGGTVTASRVNLTIVATVPPSSRTIKRPDGRASDFNGEHK